MVEIDEPLSLPLPVPVRATTISPINTAAAKVSQFIWESMVLRLGDRRGQESVGATSQWERATVSWLIIHEA